MRSTLVDIAKELGVSTATVDRVLNNRPGVTERTRTIVMDAARRIGYFGEIDFPRQTIRLDFVLPAGTNTFIQNLKNELERQCAGMADVEAFVHSVEGFNPLSLATKLACAGRYCPRCRRCGL